MKRTLLVFSLLVSAQGFAQESSPSDFRADAGAEVSFGNKGLGIKPNFNVETENYEFNAGIGRQSEEYLTIGHINVELKGSYGLGSTQNLKLLVGYNPLQISSTAIANTTEAFLKAKLGLQYKDTIIKYSFSPLSSFGERNSDVARKAIYHGGEIEQKIGEHLSLEGLIKYGAINNEETPKKGSYLRTGGQLNYEVADGVTVFAYYDKEKFDYSVVDRSVANESRELSIKNNLSAVGIGVKIDVSGSSKQ